MTKGSSYAQQIVITEAGTMKLGLSWTSFRVIRGRVNRVSLYIGLDVFLTNDLLRTRVYILVPWWLRGQAWKTRKCWWTYKQHYNEYCPIYREACKIWSVWLYSLEQRPHCRYMFLKVILYWQPLPVSYTYCTLRVWLWRNLKVTRYIP